MDYTVGSVADLVAGKNTPNKPNVFKKTLPKPNINTDITRESKHSENNSITVGKTKNSLFSTGKKGNKPIRNKKTKDAENIANTSLMVIDHKLIEGTRKQELKNETNREEHTNSGDENSVQNDKRKTQISNDTDRADNDLVPSWQNPAMKKELDSRTIFVGNVGITVKKTQLLKFFGKYGKIQSVRLRCATPANPGVSKRLAVIKKMLHPKRATLHSYITFENRKDALKALEINGTKYKEHHLRVQMCDDLEKPDAKKAVFVGNLPFDVEDDDLWAAFEQFGLIKSVRVVRNATTGMGIGIGYINFDSPDSVEFALQMQDITVKNKVVRVKRYIEGNKKNRKEKRRERHKKFLNRSGGQEDPVLKQKSHQGPNAEENKKIRHNLNQPGGQGNSKLKRQGQKNRFEDNSPAVNIKNSVFQGSKSNKKKQKPKVNRGIIQKMKLSQKIAPRPIKS